APTGRAWARFVGGRPEFSILPNGRPQPVIVRLQCRGTAGLLCARREGGGLDGRIRDFRDREGALGAISCRRAGDGDQSNRWSKLVLNEVGSVRVVIGDVFAQGHTGASRGDEREPVHVRAASTAAQRKPL